MSSLAHISQQVTVYWGIFIIVTGLFGNIMNVMIFLSLKTFRNSSCGLYLNMASVFNIGQLITSVLSRVMITGFNIDWTQTSVFYCKFRTMCLHLCSLVSFTCLSLSTIDQYMATNSRHHWRQFCQIKWAFYLSFTFVGIWILHEIPALMFMNINQSSNSSKSICLNTNFVYRQYVSYVYLCVLTGILPMLINIFFGSLAYRNVRQIPYRVVPLVRRELDKQLTSMVLIQVIYSVIVTLPYNALTIVIRSITVPSGSFIAEQLDFAYSLVGFLYYMYFIVSNSTLILLIYLFIYLGIILYLSLCFKTISTTICLCYNSKFCLKTSTGNNYRKSNSTIFVINRTVQEIFLKICACSYLVFI